MVVTHGSADRRSLGLVLRHRQRQVHAVQLAQFAVGVGGAPQIPADEVRCGNATNGSSTPPRSIPTLFTA
jgi:hypothetical protein